ncbi:MAG: multiple sugar transport system substrate-binding protein [Solirubrobacterales bacterium]|jgi:multiple sugar transport system substrate-binding protein|nr:multiple sugar transport system substrate-binding protein [Solirubrobacterales bacterium]
MKLRGLLTAASLASLTALVAGCGGGDGATTNGGGSSSAGAAITLQVSGDTPELSSYPKLVDAYEKQSGRRVKLVTVDKGANFQKLTSAFAGGDPPDAFLASYSDAGAFAAKGVLEPVGPRLDAAKGVRRSDYYRQALDAFTSGGQLECMPQDISGTVVFYNRDAFRRAGLSDPAAGWTYDELKVDAAKLRASFGGQRDRFAVGFEPDMQRLASFVFAAGGKLVDDDLRPTGFTLDTPAARNGLKAFFGLAPYSAGEDVLRSREPDELFAEGQIAIFIDARQEVTKLREIKSFDWDVAPFPRIASGSTAQRSDGYCIAKGSNADAAWDFIRFATGPAGQRLLAASGRIMPALRPIAESDAFLAPKQKPRSSRVFLDAVSSLKRLPASAGWAQVGIDSHAPIEEAFFESARAHDLKELSEEFLRKLNAETAGKF